MASEKERVERSPLEELTQYARPEDVMEATRLSKSTIFKALKTGSLKGYQVGRAWLIPVYEVDRWIRSGAEQD